MHLYPSGQEGWCLTWKEPIFGGDRRVVGLVGLSRDLRSANASPRRNGRPVKGPPLRPNATGNDFESPRHREASEPIGFPVRPTHTSDVWTIGGAVLTGLRIDLASERLRRGNEPVSQIALDCGYADQTAFSRQFRKTVGVSPGVLRRTRSPDAARISGARSFAAHGAISAKILVAREAHATDAAAP